MENGDALYQKFMSSKQAPVRLELALSGFFQPDGYTDKQHRDFGDHLRLRIRPAAEALIQRDALDKLQVLEELGWMDASVIENCMDYAIRNQKTQAFIWLLERKTRKYGFHDRSFDL